MENRMDENSGRGFIKLEDNRAGKTPGAGDLIIFPGKSKALWIRKMFSRENGISFHAAFFIRRPDHPRCGFAGDRNRRPRSKIGGTALHLVQLGGENSGIKGNAFHQLLRQSDALVFTESPGLVESLSATAVMGAGYPLIRSDQAV
nr:hypothetical protein [Luteolibacter yonseiensis]